MSIKYKGDIVHTEKYVEKGTGEEKKKHIKAGALFEREDGSLCIKFFDTWFNIYEPRVKDFSEAKQAAEGNQDDFSDSIPF